MTPVGQMAPDGDYECTGISAVGGRVLRVIVRCLHAPAHVENVISGGEVVAFLCTDCDTQLPPDWRPRT